MAFYKLPCCGYRLNQIDKWYINEISSKMDSFTYIISTYENSKYYQLGSISIPMFHICQNQYSILNESKL